MRSAIYDSISDAGRDELVTTGEAAKLLNSSRQHVVDLCERGDLPYTTTGRHRRIRRSDIEQIRTRTERLTRDQQRSLWLAYATVARIVEDPRRARALALANLGRMRAESRGQAVSWLEEWEQLVIGPVDRLLSSLVSPSPRGRELRQNSPFAGLLSDAQRVQVLHEWAGRDASADE
jgi:excisionase family DNA binding protein